MSAAASPRRRPRAAGRAAAGLAAVVLTAAAAAAQERLHYREADFTLPEPVTECVLRDVDGDGRDDVFLVLGRRHWRLRYEQAGLVPWTEEPELFSPRAVGFDLGRLPGESRWTLAVLHEYGRTIVESRPTGARPDPLPPPGPAAAGDVFRTPLFHDPGDGGAPVVLHSRWRGCELRRITGRGADGAARFEPGERLEFAGDHRLHISGGSPFDRIETETTIPAPVLGDVDGDGRPDVALMFARRLEFFVRDADGTLAGRSAHSFPLPPRAVGTRLLSVVLPPRLVDLDGDGTLDLVDVDANAGLVRVHIGPLVREAARRPHSVLRFGRTLLDVAVVNADGDGRPDLRVIATEPVTLVRSIQMFLTQRMPVRVLTFRQDAHGRFTTAESAVVDAHLPVVVDTSQSPPKARPVPLFLLDRDLDGDGRADVVLSGDWRHLAVYRGAAVARLAARLDFPEGAGVRWHLVRTGDLDGDGRLDILVAGWDSLRRRSVLRAWLSGER
ncbi:MAG: VCBS repeat-containing protein [Planctomycetes bacterium]|nr:VCBS repeat-containing protein [Planctomycetota bacterium]